MPFAMSGDKAMRIGYGLLADSAVHMALAYFEVAQKEKPGFLEVKTGVAHCYYELKRDDEALALYKEVIAQRPTSGKSSTTSAGSISNMESMRSC